MMKAVLTAILALLSMTIQGQSYTALWKQADDAEKKDLPRTQYDVLMKIVKKAQREGQYGQLMAAELAGSRVMATVSPDSLQPAVNAIESRWLAAKDKAVKVVYTTLLKKIYADNSELESVEDLMVTLDDETCRLLAAVKAADYKPLVVAGRDSRWFNDDLLSVVGYQLSDFRSLNTYYNKVGNRVAALMTALELARQNRPLGSTKLKDAPYLQTLDSLITLYGDLPEAGELSLERYTYMSEHTDATAEQLWNYSEDALRRWGGYSRIDQLRNAQKNLTFSRYDAQLEHRVSLPEKGQTVRLWGLRSVQQLTVHLYEVKVNGNTQLDPSDNRDLLKLRPLLHELSAEKIERQYPDRPDYEQFEDSIQLPPLPIGVYMVEIETRPATTVARRLLYVSNVRTMVEAQPDNRIRYVVVDALDGQPVQGATIELTENPYGNDKSKKITLETDAKGEAYYRYTNSRPSYIYTYTSTDKACPQMNGFGNFYFSDAQRRVEQKRLFTDRAIYRPGQTVHVAAISYEVPDGIEQKALEGQQVTLTLRDANYKVVAERQVVTDAFGTCAADFTLPSGGLTGRFSISSANGSCSFLVEEYKRPSFEVAFDEYKLNYQNGDTVTVRAVARSYTGVPVQGAKVKYTVLRRSSFWWWAEIDEVQVAEGETMTTADGSFTVDMLMKLPPSDRPMFYNFVCRADVTDQAGETHQGQFSLPLGNRGTAFSLDMPDQIRADKVPTATFHLRNAAGKDIDATVSYRFDDGMWLKAATAKGFTPSITGLKSGRHSLEAICEGDTLTKSFTVFSLDDKQPAFNTDDWFFVSSDHFPNDGSPVTVQVGSSAADVHIVYSVFCGNRVVDSGAMERSNQLINRKLTYSEDYGNGLLLTFAWVKNGRLYHHEARITRPLPDKKLKMEWRTFRDYLTPGQKEEWTLYIAGPDGKPLEGAAQLMATLYDKSLDQIVPHQWAFSLYKYIPLPMTQWQFANWGTMHLWGAKTSGLAKVSPLDFSHFDEALFPQPWMSHRRHLMLEAKPLKMAKAGAVSRAQVFDSVEDVAAPQANAVVGFAAANDEKEGAAAEKQEPEVSLRENLQETAFFYPQLLTDEYGRVSLKFTLPECLTTWRFMGLAHTADLCYGQIEAETVARKDLMVQPNMPRFVREGDRATIAARIMNISEHDLTGTAHLTLIDPATEKPLLMVDAPFAVKPAETTSVMFCANLDSIATGQSLLIARITAQGDGFSDGEQHYLPILPARERVTVTVPFSQNGPGRKSIDLTKVFPQESSNPELTVEYTNNPAMLMVQALPAVGHAYDDCAICQSVMLYANAIGKCIIDRVPQAKQTFEQWKREAVGLQSTLHSQLDMNQKLKDLMLDETPWQLDADAETEQRERVADFFDENIIGQRLASAVTKLAKLQRADGSWSWWPEMPGSIHMTMTITELLTRLNEMTGEQAATRQLLDRSMKFLGSQVVKQVEQLKELEKKGRKPSFPDGDALQWLYICKLDGRKLPVDLQQANQYLLKLLRRETKNQTIYEKALSAIIFDSSTYIKSLKEYTVYSDEMGRYYDTPRADYSWRDYRIPTQVVAIEALQRLTPDDEQTLSEMRRWLLQQKRTQVWDTPLNSVDAVYAFLMGSPGNSGLQELPGFSDSPELPATLYLDKTPIVTSQPTAGLGYVKTSQRYTGQHTFAVDKQTEGTSWGAVYAQFVQPTAAIADHASGVSVKREVLSANGKKLAALKVGDRILVRLIITADRDLDFVQLQDHRAACMEPVNQLSGYSAQGGYYMTPRDNVTNYYFDRLPKGKRVVETEYYLDRAGEYETGTCTVQCAYAPEYRGTTKSQTLKVE